MGKCYFEMNGKNCSVTIESRPYYCDRGNFIAKIFINYDSNLYLDEQDGWPRYYFNLNFAKLEVESWLIKRNEFVTGNEWKVYSFDDILK